MASERLRGVIAPNLTPFNDDLSVATDLYVAHAKACLADGCVGLAPFGTTGEALSVGIGERMATLEALVSAGVPAAKLIPGTGLTNLTDTATLTRHALELGCAGAMTLPPFYFKGVDDQGLVDYFERLIERIGRGDTRLYLYHIPQVSGVGIPPAVVETLFRRYPEQIVGIKDSSGEWENTRALLGIEGLIVYPGSELPLIEALELGAAGCISATANLNAAGIAEVIRRWDAGDKVGAKTLHEEVKKLRLLVQGYAPIPAQKRILALRQNEPRWPQVRPPLHPLDEAKGRELAEKLNELEAKEPA